MANVVSPSEATYYAELIVGKTFCGDHGTLCRRSECERRFGTDTDYSYQYFDDEPTAEDLRSMVPEGWYRIERKIKKLDRS